MFIIYTDQFYPHLFPALPTPLFRTPYPTSVSFYFVLWPPLAPGVDGRGCGSASCSLVTAEVDNSLSLSLSILQLVIVPSVRKTVTWIQKLSLGLFLPGELKPNILFLGQTGLQPIREGPPLRNMEARIRGFPSATRCSRGLVIESKAHCLLSPVFCPVKQKADAWKHPIARGVVNSWLMTRCEYNLGTHVTAVTGAAAGVCGESLGKENSARYF